MSNSQHDAGDEFVSDKTREVEEEDARQPHQPDDDPTADEEHAAERSGDVDDDVRGHYEDMAKTGAEAKGEGRIS